MVREHAVQNLYPSLLSLRQCHFLHCDIFAGQLVRTFSLNNDICAGAVLGHLVGTREVHSRLILAPTPRERVRWHAIWLLAQGWTASAVTEALERDPHTIGRWLAALGEGGPAALIFEQSGGPPR